MVASVPGQRRSTGSGPGVHAPCSPLHLDTCICSEVSRMSALIAGHPSPPAPPLPRGPAPSGLAPPGRPGTLLWGPGWQQAKVAPQETRENRRFFRRLWFWVSFFQSLKIQNVSQIEQRVPTPSRPAHLLLCWPGPHTQLAPPPGCPALPAPVRPSRAGLWPASAPPPPTSALQDPGRAPRTAQPPGTPGSRGQMAWHPEPGAGGWEGPPWVGGTCEPHLPEPPAGWLPACSPQTAEVWEVEGGRGPASARLPRGPLIRHHGSPTGERAPWVGGHRPASTPQTRLPTPSAPRKSQALNLDESGPRPWLPRCPTEGERKMETSPGLRSDPVRCLSSSVLTGQAAGAGTGGARSSGGAGSSGGACGPLPGSRSPRRWAL